ncbi:hypothetical protein Poly59_46670 [Rubripirellula reticaptiva]|uniref:Uncharacterized protein n=1 Tax=Rubripirellula reticaptiva TaxID=2528013 RepID=A0A5C6EHA7_9BACT|nr:hypothetical protein Poly59_46670 [Rubripirellula reticaptiva]
MVPAAVRNRGGPSMQDGRRMRDGQRIQDGRRRQERSWQIGLRQDGRGAFETEIAIAVTSRYPIDFPERTKPSAIRRRWSTTIRRVPTMSAILPSS